MRRRCNGALRLRFAECNGCRTKAARCACATAAKRVAAKASREALSTQRSKRAQRLQGQQGQGAGLRAAHTAGWKAVGTRAGLAVATIHSTVRIVERCLSNASPKLNLHQRKIQPTLGLPHALQASWSHTLCRVHWLMMVMMMVMVMDCRKGGGRRGGVRLSAV